MHPFEIDTLVFTPKEVNMVVPLDKFYYLLALYQKDEPDSPEARALISLALITGHTPDLQWVRREIEKLHVSKYSVT